MELHPYLFCLFFCLLYFSYLLLKTIGCSSGCLMSSACIQKLFCGIYLAFECSFDEFVGEKVFSPSYSSGILRPPPGTPHNSNVGALILSQRSLRLSSLLFILFTLFCSSEVISTILSSSSLILFCFRYSAIFPSRVFLISVIVLFASACLFFILLGLC